MKLENVNVLNNLSNLYCESFISEKLPLYHKYTFLL